MKSKIHRFNSAAVNGSVIVFACFSMLNSGAQAANYYWTGSTNTDYSTGTNWVGGVAAPKDWAPVVTFDNRVVNGTVNVPVNYLAGSVVVASGCTTDITFTGAQLQLGKLAPDDPTSDATIHLAADGSNLTFNSLIGNAGWDGLLGFDVGAGRTLTLNGGIAGNMSGGGPATVVKTGTGAAVITSATSNIGGMTISEGTLQIGDGTDGHDGSLSTITTVNNNAALVYNLYGNQTAGYAISGTGALTKTGGGTLTLTGANIYTGNTTISAGTLEIGGAGTLGSGGSYAGTISNNGAFVHSSSADQTLANISGNGSITQSGTGKLTISGWGVGNGGTITVNSGTLEMPDGAWQQESHHIVVNGGTLSTSDGHSRALSWTLNGGTISSRGDIDPTGWGNMMLNDGQAVTVGGAAVSTISSHVMLGAGSEFAVGTGSTLNVTGALSNSLWAGGGNGSFIKSGDGTLALSGVNNYTGVTTLAGGVLNVATFSDYGVAGGLGNRSADSGGNVGILFRGGTLQYTGSTAQSTNRGIRINADGGGGNAGGATIDASGSNPAATLSFTATSSPDFFEYGGNRTLTLTGSNTGANTFAMAIGDAVGATSVVKSGAGQWVLTGANTYTGNTTVNQGTLVLRDPGTSWGNGSTVSIASGATLAFDNVSDWQPVSTSMTVTGTGTFTKSGATTMDMMWGGTAGFVMNLSAGAQIRVEGGTMRFAFGNDSGNSSWNNNHASLYVGSGAIFDTWDYNTNPIYVDALTGSGTVQHGWAGAGALKIGVAGGSGTFSGTINDGPGGAHIGGSGIAVSMALTKAGAGTQTLSGANTYSGGTTVNAGTLKVTNGGALGSGNVAIGSAGALTFDTSGGSYSLNGTTITGTGTMNLTGGNTLTFGAGPVNVNLSAGAQINLQSGYLESSTGFNGIWSNNQASLNVASGAVVGLKELQVVVDALTGDGTVQQRWPLDGSGASLVVGIANGSGNFSGVIQDVYGSASVLKTGGGTQTFSGANTYAGGTTINTGTLQFAKTNSMPASGAVAVGTGATLAVNAGGSGEFTNGTSGNGTIGGLLAGLGGQAVGTVTYTGAVTLGIDTTNAGGSLSYGGDIANVGTSLGLTKLGTGTLTLTGIANTYTGATTVNAGTLKITGDAFSNGGVGSLPVGSNVTVNSGGTLLANGTNALGFFGAHNSDVLTVNKGGSLTVDAGTVVNMPYVLNIVGGTIASVDAGDPSYGSVLYTGPQGTFTSANDGTAATISALNFNLGGATFNVTDGVGAVDLNVTGNLIGGALTKYGNGVMVLSGANTYTGTTTVNNGTLALLGPGANLSASTTVTVAAGGHLWFEATTDNTGPYNYNNFALNLTGQGAGITGGPDNSGSATVFFGNNNGNTYNFGGNVTVAGGVSFATYGIYNTINLGGVFSGTGDMSFTSSGALGHNFVFSGDSSTSGYAGTYKIYSSWAAASVKLAGGDNRLPTTATVDLEADASDVATLDLNGHSQQLAGLVAGSTTANDHVLNSGGGMPTLTINNAGPITFAGQLGTGGTSFALTKSGVGTFTLSGANTYTGTTTINGGILEIANAAAVGSTSQITVNSGGQVYFDAGTTNGTISAPIELNGVGNGDGALKTYAEGGQLTFTGPITLLGSSLIQGYGGHTTLNFTNAIGGTGNLTFLGNGGGLGHKDFMVLSGASNFTGDLYIENYAALAQITLSGGENRLPTTAVVHIGAGSWNAAHASALDLNGNNQMIAGLSDSGVSSLAGPRSVVNTSGTAATLTLNTTANQSFSGTIGGTDINGTTGNNLALVKTGGSTQTLNGANTYTGATTVNAGTLTFGSVAAVGSTSGITVNSGGTVSFDNGTSGGTYSMPISLSGFGDAGGSGALYTTTAASAVTFTGPITVTGGTLIRGNTTGSTLNFTNVISGTGGLTFAAVTGGAGTKSSMVLSGASNFTGNFQIVPWWGSTQVTLSGGDDRLPTTAVVCVNGGTGQQGVLNLNGNNQTIAGLADLNGFGGLDAGARNVVNTSATPVTLTLNTTADQTSGVTIGGTDINGTTGNNLSLVKTGSAMQTLTGTNLYTGATSVSQGTLKLASATSNNIATSATLNVASGAVLDVSGLSGTNLALASGQTLMGNGNVTGGSVTVSSGATLAPGASAGTLNFAGGLTLNSGSFFNWENTTSNTLGSPGTHWDVANVTGGSTTIDSGAKLNLQFTNVATNFSAGFWNGNKTWDFITGGASAAIPFDPSNIAIFINGSSVGTGNSITDEGAFTTVVSGNNLQLQWTAIGAAPTQTFDRLTPADPVNARANSTVSLSGTLSNTGGRDLAVALTSSGTLSVTGLSSDVSPINTTPGTVTGTIHTGTTAGLFYWGATNTDGAATNSTATISGAVNVYDLAHAKYTGATLAFGNVHQGASVAPQSVAIGNQTVTDASYQDSLDVSATTDNAKVTAPTGISGLAATAGGATTQNLSFHVDTSTPGSLASTASLTLTSNANGVTGLSNGTATVVGSPTAITTTGGVYSGQMVWSGASGNWSTGSDWTDSVGGGAQAAPGTDSNFTGVDSATFGASGTHTITVDQAANLNVLGFNGLGNYTLSGSSSLTLAGAAAAINVTSGAQEIGAPVTLANNVAVAVTAGSLKISGNISGTSKTLTKSGGGILELAGTNNYGTTSVTAGTLFVNGSTAGNVSVTGAGTTLGGTGTIGGGVTVTGGAYLSPGSATTSLQSLATGALSLDSTSRLVMEALNNTATGADLMVATGDVVLGSATLDLTGLTGATYSWTGGTTLTLLSYPTGHLTGTFNGYADDRTYLFGSGSNTKAWTLNYNAPLTASGANFAGDLPGSGAQLVTVTMDAYYTWAASKGLTHNVDGTDGTDAPNVDTDNDGAKNLAEFAFNGDPMNATSRGLTYTKMVAGVLNFTCAVRDTGSPSFSDVPATHAQTTTVDGVKYTIEANTALTGTWQNTVNHASSAYTLAGSGLPDLTGTGWKYHTFTTTPSTGTKVFIRAKVEK